MDPSSSRPSPAVFSRAEMEACRALFQMGLKTKKKKRFPFSWGVKRPRTQRRHVSNYDNRENPSASQVIRQQETPVKIMGPMEQQPVFKEPPPPQGIASPTSPLLHGSVSMSSQGEPSDSNNSLPTSPFSSPQDHAQAPKLQFKAETKAEVHSSPNSRGPKRKKVEELKQRVDEQLMLKEELEKEKKMLVDCHESLMDENKNLKEQLALKSQGKEENMLFLSSFDSSQQTMLPHSRVNHSSSDRVILPDLNIPFEESTDNSSGDFDNHLLKTDKLVAAAHARKYRVDYLRHKQSQSVNVQSK